MKYVIIVLALAVSGFVVFSCLQKKDHKIAMHVMHLKDGRYCYSQRLRDYAPGAVKGDDGNWIIWYWLILNNGGTNNYYTSYNNTSTFSPPKGTQWEPAGSTVSSGSDASVFSAAPTESELEKPISEPTEELVVDEAGHPEVDADGNLVDPTEISSSPEPEVSTSTDTNTSTSESTSSDSGSTSGDSGGGGGDGGGGGGGD